MKPEVPELAFGLRVATGQQFGAGHRTRCSALAGSLPAGCRFYCDPGAPISGAPGCVFETAIDAVDVAAGDLRTGAIDALIVDHYGIRNSCIASAARFGPVFAFRDGPPYGPETQTIDINPGADADFAGPAYAPLSNHFGLRHPAPLSGKIPKDVRGILVSFGARDSRNCTTMVLRAIAGTAQDIPVTVAVGAAFAHLEEMTVAAEVIDAKIAINVADMHSLYGVHDLAVGAPGVSQFERAACGLATILVPQNDRQIDLAQDWAKTGVAVHTDADPAAISQVLEAVLGDLTKLDGMRRAAKQLVDGQGARRLANALVGWLAAAGQARSAMSGKP